MNLRSAVEKLDQFVELLWRSHTPPAEEIRSLQARGLTETEACQVWRHAIRGRGWTIDSIEEIEDTISRTLAQRTGNSQSTTATGSEA